MSFPLVSIYLEIGTKGIFAVADLEDEPIGEICPRTISLRENHPEDRQRQNLKLLRILKVFAKHLDSNKPSRRFYSPGLLPFG